MNRTKYNFNKLRAILILCAFLFGISGCAPSFTNLSDPDTYSSSSVQSFENSSFCIEFLDVGQADAALISCDEHYMLIDGGNTDSSSRLYTILKNKGIQHLDIVVGTHADADHIGGLAGALNYADADIILCSTTDNDTKAFHNFKKYADQNGGGIVIPEIGDKYYLGSSLITILSVNAGNDSNNSSIVLKLEYGDISVLFTGDAEISAEEEMIDRNADLSADVLKVGHHGSAGSSSLEFLKEVDPDYAVISVGKNNSYSHPTKLVLDRLYNLNTKIYRTDLQGTITLISDGKNITFSSEKAVFEKEILKTSSETSDPQFQYIETVESEELYILNNNTKKFHCPECSSVKRIHVEHKEEFYGTRSSLISMGYEGCKNCNP